MSDLKTPRHWVLSLFTVILVAESVRAEVAAPNASTAAPSAPHATLAPVSEDPIVKELDGKSLRPDRRNDKTKCPGGKMKILGKNKLMIYTNQNSEGLYFGPGKMLSLEPTTEDIVLNTVKRDAQSGQSVSCKTVIKREAIQVEDEVSVTEHTEETCGRKVVRKKELLKIKNKNGKKSVTYDLDSDSPQGEKLKCNYNETLERPRPVRPF